MKNEPLYRKTCDILYDAYFKGILFHDCCVACAVGNLISKANNYTVIEMADGESKWIDSKGNIVNEDWTLVLCTPKKKPFKKQRQYIHLENFNELAQQQILSTGYNIGEFSRLEYAFESAPKGKSEDEYMFNGLVAVIEVLSKIHEVEEDTQIARFKNHYKTKLTNV